MRAIRWQLWLNYSFQSKVTGWKSEAAPKEFRTLAITWKLSFPTGYLSWYEGKSHNNIVILYFQGFKSLCLGIKRCAIYFLYQSWVTWVPKVRPHLNSFSSAVQFSVCDDYQRSTNIYIYIYIYIFFFFFLLILQFVLVSYILFYLG